MLLTDAERERFATYLELEAESDEGIATQMETLPHVPQALVKKLRTEGMAAKIIAAKLRSAESMSIRRE